MLMFRVVTTTLPWGANSDAEAPAEMDAAGIRAMANLPINQQFSPSINQSIHQSINTNHD
jgi:hypothetical protein